jgi:hypothetical protein
MKDLTLSIAQMAPALYDVSGNLAKITGFMEERFARQRLLVF